MLIVGGSFNWKLAYTILLGDAELDVLEPNVNPHTSATKTAVMPGGLFAMDRRCAPHSRSMCYIPAASSRHGH